MAVGIDNELRAASAASAASERGLTPSVCFRRSAAIQREAEFSLVRTKERCLVLREEELVHLDEAQFVRVGCKELRPPRDITRSTRVSHFACEQIRQERCT